MTLEEEFAATGTVHLMLDAPRNGTPIIGRSAQGALARIWWRTGADLDEGEPYWARWDTDETFEPVAWAPSQRSIDDLLTE